MSALDLMPIFKQHRQFAILSSIGMTFLYIEEGWASYVLWSQRSLNQALGIIGVIGLIALIGYLISFFFPPTLVSASWDHPRPWGVFSNVTAWSAGITLIINVIIYVLLLCLVQFDFTAGYTLLRDVYVYAIFGMCFFHGLLLYVRYMQYLYTMPGFVQPVKVISASVGVGAVLLIVAGFLFLLDLYHFVSAPAAMQPLWGLHMYVRALYAFTLALAAYAWHLRWIADH
ncbi:MAG: hypothetical protein HZB51_18610 [Chloroflexi bacterium]|nr:hypothetical protein [Chloroflexota bacterium]